MSKYKINKGYIVQKLDGKTTIFDGEKSLLFTFNRTASEIFDKLKNGYDETKIRDFLVKKYEIKLPRAQKDVKELISNLLSKKIISRI